MRVLLICCMLLSNGAWAVLFGQEKKSLLWEITGPTLQKPSYLFGTIHLICKGDMLWPLAMDTALSQSDKICLEMDMDDPKVLQATAIGFIDASGKKLSQYFTATEMKQLKRFIKDSVGMDLSQLMQLKPMALQSLLLMKVPDCEVSSSYEERLLSIATRTGQEVLGLEQPEEQINLLDNLPIDSIVKGVMDDVQHFTKNKSEFRNLIQTYRSQDLEELYAMIVASGTLGVGEAAFLDNRNKTWLPRMEKMMNISSVFFAVGAGHLAGENGVIKLLRGRGYRLRAL
jgi:uncharacterized protein